LKPSLLTAIADIATGDAKEQQETKREMARFGRAGGIKGGAARSEKLSPERRAEIAEKAASKRRRKYLTN